MKQCKDCRWLMIDNFMLSGFRMEVCEHPDNYYDMSECLKTKSKFEAKEATAKTSISKWYVKFMLWRSK